MATPQAHPTKKRAKRIASILKVAVPIAALCVSLVAVASGLYVFRAQVEVTNRHMEANLANDLFKEFYANRGKEDLYKEVRMAVERCKSLYSQWGGLFSNDDINRYLGFFENLGFYREMGVLSLRTIDFGFGSYIIEAWEHPEVKTYIAGLREGPKQEAAFDHFERLAQAIEAVPDRSREVQRTRLACVRPIPSSVGGAKEKQ